MHEFLRHNLQQLVFVLAPRLFQHTPKSIEELPWDIEGTSKAPVASHLFMINYK